MLQALADRSSPYVPTDVRETCCLMLAATTTCPSVVRGEGLL